MLEKFEGHLREWAIIYILGTYFLWVAIGLYWFRDFIRDFAGISMIVIVLFYLTLCELPRWIRSIIEMRKIRQQ